MLIFFLYQNPYLSNGGQVFQNTYIFLSFPPSDYKDLTKIQFLDRRQSIVYRILSQKFYLIEIEYSFLAIKISSCGSSIYQKISSGNKGSPITHQQFGNICHFVCCSRTMCRTLGKHLLIKFSTYTVELIKSQWGNNDARGEIELMRAPLLPHFTASDITRFTLQRLANWYAWSVSLICCGCKTSRSNSLSVGVQASSSSVSAPSAGRRCPD